MDPCPNPRRVDGFVTTEVLAATALSLVLFASLVNLAVFQYARGVLRAAADEGARAGGRFGSGVVECERRADAVVGDLLGGRLGSGIVVSCDDHGNMVRATVAGRLRGWAPLVGVWDITATADSHRERAP